MKRILQTYPTLLAIVGTVTLLAGSASAAPPLGDGQVSAIVYDKAEPAKGFGKSPHMKFVGSADSEKAARALMSHPDAGSYAYSGGAVVHETKLETTDQYYRFHNRYDFKRGKKLNREEAIYVWKSSLFVAATSPRSFAGTMAVCEPREIGRMVEPNAENLTALVTHFHHANNDRQGYRALAAPKITDREDAIDLTLQVAQVVFGDFGVGDKISVIACTFRVDKKTGSVKLVGKKLRDIRGRSNPNPTIGG